MDKDIIRLVITAKDLGVARDALKNLMNCYGDSLEQPTFDVNTNSFELRIEKYANAK
tara:strand:+ start:286 stop:456 length:171 start_codon:yes stop_codon:yes gene_type:complete